MGVAVGTRFRPFVPRLAAEWAATAPDERWRTIEASLLGLDISGFPAQVGARSSTTPRVPGRSSDPRRYDAGAVPLDS